MSLVVRGGLAIFENISKVGVRACVASRNIGLQGTSPPQIKTPGSELFIGRKWYFPFVHPVYFILEFHDLLKSPECTSLIFFEIL